MWAGELTPGTISQMTAENTCITEESAFQQLSKPNILQPDNHVFMKSYKRLWMFPTDYNWQKKITLLKTLGEKKISWYEKV